MTLAGCCAIPRVRAPPPPRPCDPRIPKRARFARRGASLPSRVTSPLDPEGRPQDAFAPRSTAAEHAASHGSQPIQFMSRDGHAFFAYRKTLALKLNARTENAAHRGACSARRQQTPWRGFLRPVHRQLTADGQPQTQRTLPHPAGPALCPQRGGPCPRLSRSHPAWLPAASSTKFSSVFFSSLTISIRSRRSESEDVIGPSAHKFTRRG
jgi:hypothetical protein